MFFSQPMSLWHMSKELKESNWKYKCVLDILSIWGSFSQWREMNPIQDELYTKHFKGKLNLD